MTPALSPFELAVLRLEHAKTKPRPFPPDRFLRARALALASCSISEGLLSAAIAKSAIVDAMIVRVRELVQGSALWGVAAEGFQQLADRSRRHSPWDRYYDALRAPDVEGGRAWLFERGAWIDPEGNRHGG